MIIVYNLTNNGNGTTIIDYYTHNTHSNNNEYLKQIKNKYVRTQELIHILPITKPCKLCKYHPNAVLTCDSHLFPPIYPP